MSDQVLTRDGPVAVPLDYSVPASGELIPKTVRATMDGTSAASEFFAAVQVISPSGRVMFSAVSEAIAAGASADVSWFPRVGGASGSTPATGAWTQVFHFDVPALGSPVSIDTAGSTWSSNTTNIFGLFIGSSTSAIKPDILFCRVNNDALSHYGFNEQYADAFISGTPGAYHSDGNVLDTHGSLGYVGSTADSLGTSAISFWIPKVYQSSQSGKIIANGGYAGVTSGVNGTAVTSYEFSTVNRLLIYFKSGAAFTQGSSLTLWAV